MINLLPIHIKKQIRAARANVLLVRYNFLLGIAAAFLALGSISVYVVMSTIKTSAETTEATNKSKISNFSSIETEANAFRANLTTAKSILDKEVVYTNAIINIAQTIPQGVTINDLNLSPETFGKPMVINANAKTYSSAIGLKDSLEKSGLFTDVHFSNISTNPTGGDASTSNEYPYSVTLGATINKEVALK